MFTLVRTRGCGFPIPTPNLRNRCWVDAPVGLGSRTEGEVEGPHRWDKAPRGGIPGLASELDLGLPLRSRAQERRENVTRAY